MRCNKRRIRRLAIELIAVLSLASAFPVMADTVMTSKTQQGSSAAPVQSQPSAVLPPAQVTLHLKTEGRRLYANIVIETLSSAPRIAQKMRVQWMPPAHSYCTKSEYALFYCGKVFHTRSFRTIIHTTKDNQTKRCDGLWHVFVKDEAGNVLAQAEIRIPENKSATSPVSEIAPSR